MTVAPLIGIVGRQKFGREIEGIPAKMADHLIDMYVAGYSSGVIEAGGIPVNLPVDLHPSKVIDRLDGVVLTGGTDVDPARYGQVAHAELLGIETERDEFEWAILAGALERETPVLGICRGLQVINVFQGGTLDQHVPEHARYDVAPNTEVHGVDFVSGSVLHSLYGDTHKVNSLHHQSVAEVGQGLTVTGRDPEGGVEALEMGDSVLAVQWHPEMMDGRATDPLFGWLVDRANQR